MINIYSNYFDTYEKKELNWVLLFLLRAGPPVEVVLVSLPLFLVFVVISIIEFLESLGELRFTIGDTTALTTIHPEFSVPLQFSTTLCTVRYSIPSMSIFGVYLVYTRII